MSLEATHGPRTQENEKWLEAGGRSLKSVGVGNKGNNI
jgi:hypothetical protein